MSFDDRLRQHLQDAGDGIEVGRGRLTSVRARAQRRNRRQQAMVGAVGATAVVAVVGLSVALLRSGQGDDLELAGVVATAAPLSSDQITDAQPGDTIAAAAPEAEAEAEVESGDGDTPTIIDEPDLADGDAAGSAETDTTTGALAAATSTTTVPETPTWTQAVAPVDDAVFVDYEFLDDALIARTTNEWFVDFGDGWQPLPPLPGDMVAVAAAFDPRGGLHVVGNVDNGPCERQHVVASHDQGTWSTRVVVVSDPGTRATLLGAQLRLTELHTAVSGTQEVRLDAACILDLAGVEGSDARLGEQGISYLDADGGEAELSFADAGLDPEQLPAAGDDPARRTFYFSASSAEPEAWEGWWSPPSPAGASGPPDLAVVGSDILGVTADAATVSSALGALPPELVAEDVVHYEVHDGSLVAVTGGGSWLTWDGNVVAKYEAPVTTQGRVIDAIRSDDGWVVVMTDGTTTWLHTPTESVELAAISGKESLSARLGDVAGEIRLVTESPVGPTVFGYRVD